MTDPSPPEKLRSTLAEELFADWIARRSGGESLDIEDLCRRHPEIRADLQQMHAGWQRLSPILAIAGSRETLASPLPPLADDAINSSAEYPVPALEDFLTALAGREASFRRYHVEGEVARGGMGVILRAWDNDVGRPLAMKVVRGPEVAGRVGVTPPTEARALARFLEEARVTGQLDHPGIVPVHELGLDDGGRLYFTMRLVQGRDLAKIFDLVREEREGWSETRALSAILKACEALSYAHARGVIHRDVKPSNIMVGRFGEVYVMDWGLARVLTHEDRGDIRVRAPPNVPDETALHDEPGDRGAERMSPLVTMEGDVLGTASYMSPEQARGDLAAIGPQSDVYSIGAILYHLLARHAPYFSPGSRLAPQAVWMRVQAGPPASLREVAPGKPPELVAICERAMAREPERRYRDVQDLAEDLRSFLENRVVAAYETGAWAEAKKWVVRNKALAASLAAAVVSLVAGLTASLVFKAHSDSNAALASQRADETAEQARIARANESRATEEERIATAKANDVLSLSAIQDLQELELRADALWPADPENAPKYEAWLSEARRLIEGQPGDATKGLKPRPSLAEHEAKLAEIRLRAKPLSAEQIEADRRANPNFAEREKVLGQIVWMRRLLGEEPWPAEREVEATLAKEELPTGAFGLNYVAWKWIDTDPAKIVYGEEVRGLILARRAAAAANDAERAGIRDTLAWAEFRVGRFDEALAEEQRAVDEAQGERKERLPGTLERMKEDVARWKGAAERSKRSEEIVQLSKRAVELAASEAERRTYDFENGEDRWWHAQLTKLIGDLKSFTDEKTGGLYSSGTSARHGWGVVRRAAFARTILALSITGAEAKRRWDEAVAAIGASPKYDGLELSPQLGLLPIGADPESGLFEFAHLASGEAAERGVDGKLILKESTGLVFVLIPGGTFRMGAQSGDPQGPNYDARAASNESPVHEVTLSPYFLSKYEMTQGQWERFTGQNPSNYGPGRNAKVWNRDQKGWSALHPVEQVSCTECMEVMSRLGLVLPSEAQWENGARGGRDTPFWTGSDLESLKGAANLLDAYAKSHGDDRTSVWEKDFDDGNTVHAEVGSYRANPFGLHDVVGNVWEWCLDGYETDFYSRSPRVDPVAPWTGVKDRPGVILRVYRGGSFTRTAEVARAATRGPNVAEIRDPGLGLRPARGVTQR